MSTLRTKNLTQRIILHKSFTHYSLHSYMSQLQHFSKICGFVSKYWLCQIIISSSLLNHRKTFLFFIHHKLTLNYVKEITYHPLSSDFILCISHSSTLIGANFTRRVNLFMLYISGEFHDKSLAKIRYIIFYSHYKSSHISCRLQIVSIKFTSNVV